MLPLRIYLSFEKFLKGLPIIRDIPGFSSLPPNLTPKNLRFYKLGNLVYTLGMFVHASWIWIFLLWKVNTLAYINIASVAVYIFNIIINRKGYHFASSVIMVFEIIAHQAIAIHLLGWEAGFQFWIVVIAIFPFLMPAGKWAIKGFLLLACVATYLLFDHYYSERLPMYDVSAGFILFLHVSNIVMSFISITISGAYFAIAIHETEAELAKKTEELVEAEKKVTLANVATEMAHEIQNPLNFVNNFAEMNEELLQEMKEELAKVKNSEELEVLLKNLLENSQRIKTNGKRVSTIVSMLQERVNKNQS